jgi:elongation factor Ts
MAITAGMVKELRERTSAGMLDCKNALVENDGDMNKAIEYLREKGLSKAAKKAGRIAAEGLVAFTFDESSKNGAIVEVNSETDFVSNNELFQTFVATLAEQALLFNAADIDAFLAEKSINDSAKTVNDLLFDKIAVIGENLKIRRFRKVSVDQGVLVGYSHGNGRIGVIVKIESDEVNDAVLECGRNVAMQVAAIVPVYLNRGEVSDDYLESEKAILKQVAMNENPEKPEAIIDKMIIGRLNKQLKEVCLMDQSYVKDGDLTVQQYVDLVAKEQGFKIKVTEYVRFETGEGIEKKEENFAEEVARQMQQ